jgi:hypothetical protein
MSTSGRFSIRDDIVSYGRFPAGRKSRYSVTAGTQVRVLPCRLAIKKARFGVLEVDELTVRKLRVVEREGPISVAEGIMSPSNSSARSPG